MTPLRVLTNAVQFFDAVNEGILAFASAHKTEPEDAATVLGIMLRETWAGQAPGYRPKGADGAGDWTARSGGWLRREGVKIVPDLPAGWYAPRRRGQVVPGPYAIPGDGLGWGRGLFQLDFLGDQRDLICPAPWPVERQASAACAQLALGRKQLSDLGFAAHPLLGAAVVARYNASLDNVHAGLDAGNVDIATTGGDYSRDVFALRDAIRMKWPERFPMGAIA